FPGAHEADERNGWARPIGRGVRHVQTVLGVAVDVVIPPGQAPNTSTSGCEVDDFAAFPSSAVALLQRGSCTSNGARLVYDGDASDTSSYPPTPENTAIESLYLDWFGERDLAVDAVPLLLGSDSWWFVQNGVPTGGVTSGAGGLKTEAEAAVFGGVAGEPYDPCYHLACDVRSGLDTALYEQLARASAHVAEAVADTAIVE
ncbi:MAG: hypothetical protein AAF602_22540, partial [Myxococcota bacterium]